MAKEVKKPKQEVQQKRDYKNPATTIWGKVIIWILLFAMVGGVLFGLVTVIIELFN